MGLFDSLMSNAGNVDIDALAAKVGLDPDQVKQGGEALLGHLASGQHDADSAASAASAQTGIAADKLQALLPALQGALGNAGEGGLAGMASKLGGMLDRDGGGNPVNEIAGFAKGLFGKG
ncbi:MAG TPA: hypothetical protein VFL92_11705 [Sphingomonas sp.]|nr:hypothetical protein [Sphingomonas sp.]